MNIPFHSLPLETKVQVIIAYADMALVSVGRFFQAIALLAVIVLLAAIAMIAVPFQYNTRKNRRRILR